MSTDLPDPTPINSEGESPFAERPPAGKLTGRTQPPLGIVHIMLWMLGSGLILASFQAFSRLGEVTREFMILWQVMHIANSMIYGASVGGILLWIARRVTGGPPFPNQPGHWLLVWMGLGIGLSWVISGVMLAVNFFAKTSGFGIVMSLWAAHHLVFGVIYLVTAISLRDAKRWNVFFVILALTTALQAAAWLIVAINSFFTQFYIGAAFQIIHPTVSLMEIVLVVIVVIVDLRSGIRRDWLHWTGVAVLFFSNFVAFSFTVAQYFVPQV